MGFVSAKECSVKMEADGRGLSGPGQFTPSTSDQGGEGLERGWGDNDNVGACSRF